MKLRKEYDITPIHLGAQDTLKITIQEDGEDKFATTEPLGKGMIVDCIRTYDVDKEEGFTDGFAVLAGKREEKPK